MKALTTATRVPLPPCKVSPIRAWVSRRNLGLAASSGSTPQTVARLRRRTCTNVRCARTPQIRKRRQLRTLKGGPEPGQLAVGSGQFAGLGSVTSDGGAGSEFAAASPMTIRWTGLRVPVGWTNKYNPWPLRAVQAAQQFNATTVVPTTPTSFAGAGHASERLEMAGSTATAERRRHGDQRTRQRAETASQLCRAPVRKPSAVGSGSLAQCD